MSNKTKQIDYDERIVEMAATEVMHDAFMTYAEHVTLERALPRIEDGLKPVQRRILYTLHELGITPDKPYKKCARIVGEALGKFHPAGDTSVYDAMARMAQDFSMRMPLVDGHGNFGSIDGDSPAAMRYTEARMSPLALEMLRDLDKDTVPFRPNYDDTDSEPDLLPARYPNLLVNGASGIAVGLATNIPPHNLAEVIDGVILRMKKPNCTLDEMMEVIKGPDFPTGAYLLPENGLRQAYETGRGKIQIRAKTHFEQLKNGKTLIVITQTPYELKKSALLTKIQQISEAKKEIFGGIDEVRDESDREGMRGVIELKKGVDPDQMLGLLFKHTDLQTSYGINMMAIADGSPRQLGLLDVLDGYIKHQKEVVRRRTQFELEKAEKREHILAGLVVAVENIDEVIKIIREAPSTERAKTDLMKRFSLTGVQAQAVLDMRLARLNKLEVTQLRAEHAEVLKLIERLRGILASEKEIIAIIRKELRDVRRKFADERRTEILFNESAKIDIDETVFLPAEDCVVLLTRGGGLKRMSPKTLQRSLESTELDERARARALINSNTQSRLFIFSSSGQLYTIPVQQLPEARLKEPGKPLSSIVPGVSRDETILCILDESGIENSDVLYFVTASGLTKGVRADQYRPRKTKSVASTLREGDRLVYVAPTRRAEDIVMVTDDGYGVRIAKDDIPIMGKQAQGVHGMRVPDGSQVVFAAQVPVPNQSLLLATSDGRVRQCAPDSFRTMERNRRGSRILPVRRQPDSRIVGGVALDQISTVTLSGPSGQTKFSSNQVPVYAGNSDADTVQVAEPGQRVSEIYCNVLE